ncbi:RNA methyltransferase [Alloprevotella sp. oral taxon 473]|uniref:RNA methyltransferase n=1 Tax=Alloprevotella sp. oral taxon 473 TaxID=712469 RepID=UPI0002A43673|nr:RNA methyltransferase [Alloprevotella sp. oral taxon 473]EKX89860.1 RNA methyltransferase, TrmH family [Alloprevotella sp. oral taxon 473 str. F0040]
MIGKNRIKHIRQLAQKKHRDTEGLFLAEGAKVLRELLPLLRCSLLCATPDFLDSCPSEWLEPVEEVIVITQRELEQMSQLKTPRHGLALFHMPLAVETKSLTAATEQQLVLALDGVQDPGNLGTIIRIADWWGIDHVVCSHDTADVFAPKVVQATMGAIARVQVSYVDLPQWLSVLPNKVAVCGTFLDGDNIYAAPLPHSGVLVMGNEGKGISAAVEATVNHRLLIPSFPAHRPTSESLNVAIATAVAVAEFRRQA